jgi:hypothetical protein
MHLSPLFFITALALPAVQAPAEEAAAQAAASPFAESPEPVQGVLSPTGLTAPAGSLFINSYEVAGVGVTYVPVDRLQLSATTVIGPVVGAKKALPFGHLAAKLRLVDHGRLHVALLAGSSRIFAEYVTYSLDGGGVVGTLCGPSNCRSALSFGATAGYYRAEGSRDDGAGESSIRHAYWVSAVGALSPHWSVLFEAAGIGHLRCMADCQESAFDGGTLSVGPRLSWRSLTVDLALVAIFEPAPILPPLPWLAVSYRAL